MSKLLCNWREWCLAFDNEPRIERRLDHGLTNTSWLLDAGGEKLVLRAKNPARKVLGLDRHRERLILESAAKVGIAPRVFYFNPEQDILVTEYIDGVHWSPEDLQCPASFLQLMTLIQSMQSLDVNLEPFDYLHHTENYWRELKLRGVSIPARLAAQRYRLLSELNDFSRLDKSSICHHDLVVNNVIVREQQPYILDWEYAGLGNHLLDLASLIHEWRIPREKLCDYFGVDNEELAFAEDVYLYMVELWYLVTSGSYSPNVGHGPVS